MARARNIKPSFFTSDTLADCDPLARLLFAGLWTIADREGRLEDRPKKIKAEILPYDNCDCFELLEQLCKNTFILRYEVDAERYIQIKNFNKHQNPHHMEVPSVIPAPDGYSDKYSHSPIGVPQRRRIYERDKHKCRLCSSRDRLHIDHVIPVSKGGTSDDDNLRTLCHACNLSKGNRDDISLQRQHQIDNEMTSSRPQDEQLASHPTDTLNLIPPSPIPYTDSPIPHTLSTERVKPKTPALDYTPDFEEFWTAYPRHDCSKSEAFKCYKQAISGGTGHGRIIEGVREFSGYVERKAMGQRFIPHAATWLNQRRWESDYSDDRPYLDGKPVELTPKQRTVAAYAEIIAERNAKADKGLSGKPEPTEYVISPVPPAPKGLW